MRTAMRKPVHVIASAFDRSATNVLPGYRCLTPVEVYEIEGRVTETENEEQILRKEEAGFRYRTFPWDVIYIRTVRILSP